MGHQNPYGLRDLQWRFVQEYLIDLNATQAYLRAGYKGRGNVAAAGAIQLLRNIKIAAAIQSEQQVRADRIHLKQDTVLQEISLLAHSNIAHYAIDDHGNVTLTAEAPKHAMRAVASLRKKIIYTDSGLAYDTEIRLWNKPASVRMAAEHLGLFKDKVVESSDIQAAHAARQAAVTELHTKLQAIRARHTRAKEIGVHGLVTP